MANVVPASVNGQKCRFLSLPTKLQTNILIKHYENVPLSLRVRDRFMRLINTPSLAIEQTCRQLQKQSLAVRTKTLDRKLVVEAELRQYTYVPELCLIERYS